MMVVTNMALPSTQQVMNSARPANMFNAQSYLAANPDVQHGIDQGWFKDAADHFNTVGYQEVQNGRPMGLPPVPTQQAPTPQPLTVREGSDFMQNYQNPFTDDVIGAYEKDWGRALQMAQNSNNAAATAAGAFGGSGHGVGTAMTNERALDQYGRDVLGARSSNFNTAAGLGMQDAAAYNNMEGLSANLAMQGAALMPQIAQANSNLFQTDLNNIFGIGSAQQQLGQQSLDLAYDDFLKQWQYPMDMLNWASGLASGVPSGAETVGKVPTDTGGKLGGAGQAAAGVGSLITAFCWVAREVYGADNPQWLVFRSWMLTKAPKWLRNWYIKHGEATARFISDKPLVKRMLRWMMDKVV